MDSRGYYQFPHIFNDRIVFVAEDDLWLVSSSGGRAERLTAGVSEVRYPRFSPDGTMIAFVGSEEGPNEVYVMPASGGIARRLTYQACFCEVLGWSPDGREILYVSNSQQMVADFKVVFAIHHTGGLPRQIPVGTASAVSYGPRGGIVLGRNTGEYSHWKGYRGGRMGHLWCASSPNEAFERLHLDGNITNPCWIGERIYFLSDCFGRGNLFSCTPQGEDIHQHSTHHDFYARHLASDGQRLVYDAGADLYLFDPRTDHLCHLEVTLPSSRTQLNRKFVDADDYLNSVALHPLGHSLALTTRGRAFSMGNWEGPVLQHGQRDGVHYRLLQWLNDGKRLVAVNDVLGRESLVIFDTEKCREEKILTEIEFGRATDLRVSPTDDVVALTNHRRELMVVDLRTGIMRVLDHNPIWHMSSMAWSPDGRWIAYSFALSYKQSTIKLCALESGETYQLTEPILHDFAPAFDPEGKFLYFLGERVFNPVSDNLQFNLTFPAGVKPYLILLQKDSPSPFLPVPRTFDAKEHEKDKSSDTETPPQITIDLEGIRSRIVPFPVREGRFRDVCGIKGKVLFLASPVETLLHDPLASDESAGSIEAYDWKTQTSEEIIEKVESFVLSRDHTTMLYQTGNRVRILKAGDKASDLEEDKKASRETGWIALQRVKVSVQPTTEWKQMFAEAWRLQQEQFWSEAQASHIHWKEIAARYAPLLERINSRSEFSDLLWELQGELGTSHAYEYDGDYRESSYYRQGFLGVDWQYDTENQCYRVSQILKGNPSDLETTSPLAGPEPRVSVGDALLEVNGQPVTWEEHPQALLVNHGGQEVQLTIEDVQTKETRRISVKALSKERPVRYREWVESTRRRVHELSDGRVGYVHIPDMEGRGYAEFHRGYMAEYDYPALLVDVRWNGGGNVSSLLLSKLTRKRIGYKLSRWGIPRPYPIDSPRGPMVALTNEHSGSDGDLFSHAFKLLGLGPLIGKRTWGGTVGILPMHDLVDGTTTTQPEYATWFYDVGLGLENRGTDPDIEVEITPQDYKNNADPQLQRAVMEALSLIETAPSLEPKQPSLPLQLDV